MSPTSCSCEIAPPAPAIRAPIASPCSSARWRLGALYSVHVDRLGIGAGNDTFVFNAGEGDGDTIVDFAGNGAAAGDSLQFIGYGPGATFTNIDATHWQVNYSGGSSHEIITFSNGASIGATDFVFV